MNMNYYISTTLLLIYHLDNEILNTFKRGSMLSMYYTMEWFKDLMNLKYYIAGRSKQLNFSRAKLII